MFGEEEIYASEEVAATLKKGDKFKFVERSGQALTMICHEVRDDGIVITCMNDDEDHTFWPKQHHSYAQIGRWVNNFNSSLVIIRKPPAAPLMTVSEDLFSDI